MIESIFNFLTFNGVFTSLKELVETMIQWIIQFVMNLSNIFLFPIVSKINSIIPNIDNLNDKIDYVFTYASPYVNFFLDLLFISSPILAYLFLSIIFRVVIRNSSYLTKVIVQWYEKLIP